MEDYWNIFGVLMMGKWSFPSACWPRSLSADGAGETNQRKGFCTLSGQARGQSFLGSSLQQHTQLLRHPACMGMATKSSWLAVCLWQCLVVLQQWSLAPAVSGSPQQTALPGLSNHHAAHLPHSQQFWNRISCGLQ